MTTTHLDMLRRAKRHHAQSLDVLQEDGSTATLDIADEEADPEKIVVGPMLSEPVQTALAELSDEFRAVVVLADMEQLDYNERQRYSADTDRDGSLATAPRPVSAP